MDLKTTPPVRWKHPKKLGQMDVHSQHIFFMFVYICIYIYIILYNYMILYGDWSTTILSPWSKRCIEGLVIHLITLITARMDWWPEEILHHLGWSKSYKSWNKVNKAPFSTGDSDFVHRMSKRSLFWPWHIEFKLIQTFELKEVTGSWLLALLRLMFWEDMGGSWSLQNWRFISGSSLPYHITSHEVWCPKVTWSLRYT